MVIHVKVIHERFFRQLLRFSRYSHLKFRDFKIVGQMHDVQHLQWRPYDGKILTSYLPTIVMVAFYQPILVKIVSWKIWLRKFRSRSLTTTIRSYAIRWRISICISHTEQFYASSYPLWDNNILHFWPWKCRSRSRGRKTELTPFDSEYQHL